MTHSLADGRFGALFDSSERNFFISLKQEMPINNIMVLSISE